MQGSGPKNLATFAYLHALESMVSWVFMIKKIEFFQNGQQVSLYWLTQCYKNHTFEIPCEEQSTSKFFFKHDMLLFITALFF